MVIFDIMDDEKYNSPMGRTTIEMDPQDTSTGQDI
jgi:hypothetical protein